MDTTISLRQRKKLATRERLLEAAHQLFSEKGYQAATVEDITARAEVAKGTFFNYFSSKEALLAEIATWGIEQLRHSLDVDSGAPTSPLARLKLLVRLLHEQFERDLSLNRRALAMRLYHPPPPQARRQLSTLFSELVAEAQACGEIRSDIDPAQLGELIHLTYFCQLLSSRQDGDLCPSVERFERILDLYMDGLAGPSWRNS